MANTPTTDLTNVYTDGAWAEIARDTTGSTPIVDAELFLQGTDCSSQQVRAGKSGAVGGQQFDAGADITGFTDGTDVFLFWWFMGFPSALNPFNPDLGQSFTTANSPGTTSGYWCAIGSGPTAQWHWTIGASDYGSYPYGGWQNIAIDPTTATWKAQIQEGTPAASNYRYFSMWPNLSAQLNRGQSHAADAIRYGRAEIRFAGGSPAGTFSDMSDQNDLLANRWGILQKIQSGFLFKGKLRLGTSDSASAGESLLFSDANQNITIDDTRYAYPEFNLIEINNSGSNVTFENITMVKTTAYGSTLDSSRGNLIVNNGATTSFIGCSFTDMGFFDFDSGSTNTDVTFRRTDLVRQNGATFTNCDFETTNDSAHALHVSDSGADLNLITGCSFTQTVAGGDHAIRLGSVTQTKSVNFDANTLSGYTAGTLGDFVGTTGTNDAAIEVDVSSGITLTINVINNATTPSIQNLGAGTVSVVASASVSLTRLLGNTEISVLDAPSPYSATSLPAPAISFVASSETVSANTFVGDGTNYLAIGVGGHINESEGDGAISLSSSGGGYTPGLTSFLNPEGTFVFSNFPGVLQDTNATSPRDLEIGDLVRVTARNNDVNPTLQKFVTLEVIGPEPITTGAIEFLSGLDNNVDFGFFLSSVPSVISRSIGNVKPSYTYPVTITALGPGVDPANWSTTTSNCTVTPSSGTSGDDATISFSALGAFSVTFTNSNSGSSITLTGTVVAESRNVATWQTFVEAGLGDALYFTANGATANSETITVEKVNARFSFTTPVGNEIDILAYRTGSLPILNTGTIAEDGNIPIIQTGDRNYRDPA